jgi:histidinol phosphatase-like PHP family hydrolase
MRSADPGADRSRLYFDALAAARCPAAAIGMELDVAYDGSVLVRPEDEARLAFRVGAVHGLAALRSPQPDLAAAQDEFLFLVESLLRHGIHTLAHPFRVFRRGGAVCPEALFAPTVRLLRQYKTAAEINFHTNEPPPAFVRLCLDAGVPFTFGSDAHNLYEIGEFALNIELLRRCGFNGDPRDVLLPVAPGWPTVPG